MLRRSFIATVVLFVLSGFVLAETLQGIVVSLDEKEVKVKVKIKDKDTPEEKVFKTAGVKIFKKVGKDGEPTEIKLEETKDLVGKKGRAEIEVDGDKATKITFRLKK